MYYGNYFFAFNPSAENEKKMYERNIRLLETIYNVLNEYNINVKCKGYTFMKDAICIITDLKRLDICLEKEVYPLIAKKYAITGTDTVEHGIRNALKSAELKTDLLLPRLTNKLFLLMAAQEVNTRLLKELIV